MSRSILISLLLLMAVDIPVAYSQQPAPILVLVARAPGVSSNAALSVLNELNQLTNQSGLSNYNFENAGDHVGAPNFVAASTCSSTNPNTLITCAMLDNPDPNANDLVYWRDLYDADIVVLVTPFINVAVCGVTPTAMINNPVIAQANHPLGWAAVGLTCNIPGTFYPAAHEVLHLLSIEHKLGCKPPQISPRQD